MLIKNEMSSYIEQRKSNLKYKVKCVQYQMSNESVHVL